MFHLQAFGATTGAAASNSALSAVSDTIFSDRNGAFIYTERWQIPFLSTNGATLTRTRSNLPKWNAIGRHHIFPINQAITSPSPYNFQDLRKERLQLSLNEPLTWEVSNTGAGEVNRVYQIVAPMDWTMALPEHLERITVRFTASAAGTVDAWGADAAITFPDQDLRGGVYSIVGCQMFDAGSPAYRFILPRQKPSQGRLLRPGGIGLEALNNIPVPMFNSGLGEWGRFHTFELPRIQVLANATAASAQEGRLDLLYLGEAEELLNETM